jgi:hypothetical protein
VDRETVAARHGLTSRTAPAMRRQLAEEARERAKAAGPGVWVEVRRHTWAMLDADGRLTETSEPPTVRERRRTAPDHRAPSSLKRRPNPVGVSPASPPSTPATRAVRLFG